MSTLGHRKTRWVLLALSAVALGATLLLSYSMKPTVPTAQKAKTAHQLIPQQDHYAYQFTTQSDVRLYQNALNKMANKEALPGNNVADYTLLSSGTLELKLYDESPHGWTVAAKVSNVQMTINQGEANYIEHVKCPFLFDLDRQGYITAVDYARNAPEESTRFQRMLIAGIQVIFPQAPKSVWTIKERDEQGLFEAAYEVEATQPASEEQHIIKAKKRYAKADKESGNALYTMEAPPRITSSQWKLSLSLTNGQRWLAEVSGRDKTVYGPKSQPLSEASYTFKAKAVPTTDTFPDLLTDFKTAMNRVPAIKRPAQPAISDQDLSPEILRKDTEEIIEDFFALHTKNQLQAEAMLRALLRKEPERAWELINYLNQSLNDQVPTRKTAILFRILAEAGTDESQNAMLDALSKNTYNENMKQMILGHIECAPDVLPKLTNAIYDVYENHYNAPNSRDSTLSNMAILALGSIGYGKPQDADVRQRSASYLESSLNAASDYKSAQEILIAIGNHGGDELLSAVAPQLTSEDPSLRAAAFNAIRRMESKEAVDLWHEQYAQETDSAVRVSAIRALTGMVAQDVQVDWATEALDVEVETVVISELIGIIGEDIAQNPENAAILREYMNADTPREIQREIFRYISPELPNP
jgi:hypothetical protein